MQGPRISESSPIFLVFDFLIQAFIYRSIYFMVQRIRLTTYNTTSSTRTHMVDKQVGKSKLVNGSS